MLMDTAPRRQFYVTGSSLFNIKDVRRRVAYSDAAFMVSCNHQHFTLKTMVCLSSRMVLLLLDVDSLGNPHTSTIGQWIHSMSTIDADWPRFSSRFRKAWGLWVTLVIANLQFRLCTDLTSCWNTGSFGRGNKTGTRTAGCL